MCDSAMTSPESDVQKNVNTDHLEDVNNVTSPGQESYGSQHSQSTPGAPTPQDEQKASKPGPSAKAQVKAQVKPFTKESRDRLENKTIQLVREYGFQPRRKLSVEDGSILPNKYEPFPSKLYGRPLEEIDNFIYDEVRYDTISFH